MGRSAPPERAGGASGKTKHWHLEGELISKFPISSIPRPLQRGHVLTLVPIRPKGGWQKRPRPS